MKTFPRLKRIVSISLVAVFMLEARLLAQTNAPTEWLDPDTGHRVVQLSREPGSESLYFNLNPFTPDGKKMVITSSSGISLIDLQSHDVEKIVPSRLHIIMVGHKTGQIYYVTTKIENGATNRWVCSIDPNTKARKFPPSTPTKPSSAAPSSNAMIGARTHFISMAAPIVSPTSNQPTPAAARRAP
jgi:oligogalacturonide lyase